MGQNGPHQANDSKPWEHQSKAVAKVIFFIYVQMLYNCQISFLNQKTHIDFLKLSLIEIKKFGGKTLRNVGISVSLLYLRHSLMTVTMPKMKFLN